MATRLRVLLFGYGFAGAVFHAPLLRAADEYELAGIVTRSRAQEAGAAHPQARIFAGAEEALNQGGFDLAVVATPNDSHVPLATAALQAGLHVVVDKPLAPSVEQARALIELAASHDRLLTVYHNRRWDSDLLTARQLLPQLGPVYRFESRLQRLRPGIRPGWREKAGTEVAGGVLWDLGSHLIDQAIHLFGAPEQVYAETDVRRAQAEVVDDAFVALVHPGGVHSHLWMSWVAQEPGPRLRVLGRDGAYLKYGVDIQEEQLKSGLSPAAPGFGVEEPERWGLWFRDGNSQAHPGLAGNYPEFYRLLARAVRGAGPVPVDPREALLVLEVIQRATASLPAA